MQILTQTIIMKSLESAGHNISLEPAGHNISLEPAGHNDITRTSRSYTELCTLLTKAVQDIQRCHQVGWNQQVLDDGVSSENILPQVERVVSVVRHKIRMLIPAGKRQQTRGKTNKASLQ